MHVRYGHSGRQREDDSMTSYEEKRYEALYREEKEKYIRLAGELAALEEKNSLMKWRLGRLEGSRLFNFLRSFSRKGFVRPLTDPAGDESLKAYNENIELFKEPYPLWIRDKEREAFEKYSGLDEAEEADTDIMWLEAEDKDCVDERAYKIAAKYFETHPEADIWYADEDMVTEEGERCFPWFKQEPYPESLLGCYYYGSMTAFRREAFAEEEIKDIYKNKKKLYELVLKKSFTEDGFRKTGHTPLVLYHGKISNEQKKLYALDTGIAPCVFGYEPEYDGIKAAYEKAGKSGNLSIVIPSKDHPAMLARCLKSLTDTVKLSDIELIIVDNGSDEKNRKAYEELFERLRKNKHIGNIEYLHKEAEFNFARMCNRGAKRARGEYILFLNDDTYFTDASVLKILMEQAAIEGIGAVGAKLLYPDGRLQHAGISNLETGPAHKLCGIGGDEHPYFNFAMTKMNMIGVTAACLMIKNSRFTGVGGFDESFRVAYNDVDLCMRLIEAGYRNVQRNDVSLIHDESVSRGNDLLDTEKWNRLAEERERLYDKHRQYAGRDPYYPQHLRKDDPRFAAQAYNRQESRDYRDREYEEFKGNIALRKCHSLKLNIDECGIQKKFRRDEEESLLIKGWAYMEGADNARYAKRLILSKDKDMRAYDLEGQYLPELKYVFPDEKNILLSGFSLRPDKDSLSEGAWYIAVEFKDKETGSVYYAESEKTLSIGQ